MKKFVQVCGIFFNNDRDFHRKKPENLKKHSPSLIVLSQCSKNYPRIICFFSGFSIQKMAASDHSEVLVYGLNLKKNLDSHFRNLKTLKRTNYTWIIFPHTWRRQCMKESTISSLFKVLSEPLNCTIYLLMFVHPKHYQQNYEVFLAFWTKIFSD